MQIENALTSAVYSTSLFLLKTLPIIALALYAVSYSIRKGYMDRLSLKLQPFLGRLGINEVAAVSVTTSFLSPTASYSILAQAWREGRVSEREVIAISFLNSFPSVFSHLYTFFIPFVIPVLGFAGLVYTILRFAVAAVKSLIGYLMVREWRGRLDGEKATVRQFSLGGNLLRISLIMAVTYFAVSLASQFEVLDAFSMLVSFVPLPPGSIAIAVVEFLNMRAAVVLGAGFLDEGLGWKWVVVGLMLGNVVSFSARSVRHSLPMHLSLFGKFGLKIVLLNSLATLILDVALIILLVLFC
jgi:hypothetical protein